MKSDKSGCANLENGAEQYESFFSNTLKRQLVQYDYRSESGKLFSTTARSLEIARASRDEWLDRNKITIEIKIEKDDLQSYIERNDYGFSPEFVIAQITTSLREEFRKIYALYPEISAK